MDLRLAGGRAMVTGGSRGIGKAVAAAVVAEGATVTITARGADALERTAARLGACPVVADTGSDDSVRALVTRANEAIGGIDVLSEGFKALVMCAVRNTAASPARTAAPLLKSGRVRGDPGWGLGTGKDGQDPDDVVVEFG